MGWLYWLTTLIVALMILAVLRYLSLRKYAHVVMATLLALISPYAIDIYYCQVLTLGCSPDALDGLGFILRAIGVLATFAVIDFGISKISSQRLINPSA